MGEIRISVKHRISLSGVQEQGHLTNHSTLDILIKVKP